MARAPCWRAAVAPARSMYEVVVILHKERVNTKLVRWANPPPEPTRLSTALRSASAARSFLCVVCRAGVPPGK